MQHLYVRTNIYLTTRQKTTLEVLASEQGLKTAELIRRLLDKALKEVQRGS